jgi:uncharacterized cupin superfamily protein
MAEESTYLVKADVHSRGMTSFRHPLNPNSEVHYRPLSRLAGLSRIGVTHVRVPPGKESFVYHTHQHEEEFLFVLSGRGIAEIDDRELEVGPGDFMGFPTPSVGHHLRNPFDEDLVYLMGGEYHAVEIADFPRLRKRMIRSGESISIVDHDHLQSFP